MPAIKYHQRGNVNTSVVNHYQDFLSSCVTALDKSGAPFYPDWMGFICNAGASYLNGGKAVRLEVVAVSRGDGSTENEWLLVPKGHFAVGIYLPGGEHLADRGQVYSLIDDAGWPILTTNRLKQSRSNFTIAP